MDSNQEITAEPTLREILNQIKQQDKEWNEKFFRQDKEWNEKFFQLSRDTLSFARNVIVTAAIVAVIAPLLRESLTFALETLKN